MALSNAVREPRREITETLIGLAVIGLPLWLDYWVSQRCLLPSDLTDTQRWLTATVFTMVFLAFLAFMALCALVAVHLLGELLCDWLDGQGVRLRPVRRK